MRRGFLNHLYLLLQALVTLAFTAACVLLFSRAGRVDASLLLEALTLLCLFITAALTDHYRRSTVGADAMLLPPLFLSLSVTCCRHYPILIEHLRFVPLNPNAAAILSQTALLFTSLLILQVMLFQTEINNKKIALCVMLSLAIAVSVGIFVPVSSLSASTGRTFSPTSPWMKGFFIALFSSGVAAVLFTFLQVNLSRETLFKTLALLLLLAGNTIHAFPHSSPLALLSDLLFVPGLLFLLERTRADRIWSS